MGGTDILGGPAAVLGAQTSVRPEQNPYILLRRTGMAAKEEFDRIGIRAGEEYRPENGRNGSLREAPDPEDRAAVPGSRETASRAAGSPLPLGAYGRPLSGRSEAQVGRPGVPPPGRALSVSPQAEGEASGMQWMTSIMKQAVPFVQKLLPLLDGQVATAVANFLAARPHTPPAPRVDLQPLENGLADLQIQHANIKDQLSDQNAALKRVQDHLDMVREATDRNTLEQQELIEDLKTISGRMNRLAMLFLVLLVLSVLVNISLFLHIQRVLP